jgi:hypothetical protein
MADDIVKTSKQTIEAIDAIEQKLKKFQDTASKTDYYKSISKFSDEVDTMSSSFSKLEKDLNNMGINSEKALSGVAAKVNEVTKKFKSVAETTKDFSKVQGKIKEVKNILDLMNKKSLNTDDIKKYKDVLNTLGTDLDPKDFSSMKNAIQNALDSGNVYDFKKQLEKMGPTVFKGITKNLKDLKKNEDVFGSLSDESKDFIGNFYKLGQKIKNIDDLKNSFNTLEEKSSKLNSELENLNKISSDNLSNELKDVEKDIEKIAENTDAQKQFQNYFESINAEFTDLANHLKQQSEDLNLIPEEKFGTQFKHMADLQKNISNKMEEIHKINNELFEEDNPEKIEELNQKIRQTKIEISAAKEEIRDVAGQVEDWQKAYSTKPLSKYGEAHLVLRKRVIEASASTQHLADIVSKRFPALGKVFEGISNKFKSLSENSAKFKFSAGLITGGITLLKAVTEIENKTAGAYNNINTSGLLMNKSAEETSSAMRSLAVETGNILGLFKAAGKFSGSFALSREEILGTVSALDQAGLASKNLESQMQPVMSSLSGTNSEIVGAAEVVRTFSNSLGIADGEVANMMGNMAAEFNSTMGSLKENFTGITSAIQSSSMSSTRFLGILGTSTAGMSLYAEQVESTARAISHLDNSTSLSQKGIENFTKAAAQSAQDTEKLSRNLAIYLRKGSPEVKKALNDSIANLNAEINKTPDTEGNKKILAELKGQLKNTKEMSGYLEKGDFLRAAELAKYISPEANMKMQGQMLDAMLQQSKGDPLLARKLAQDAGMEAMYEEYMKLGEEGRKELLKGINEGDKKAIETFENMREKSLEVDKYTGRGLGKLIESIGSTTNMLLGSVVGFLTIIAVSMQGAGFGSGLKNIYDILKGGGKGPKGEGGLGKMILGDAKDGLKNIKDMVKGGKSGIGSLFKSIGKGALSKIPIAGALLGGGMSYAQSKSEGESTSKAAGKGIGAGVGALAGGAAGMLLGPAVAIAGAYIGEMAGEAIGGYVGDAVDSWGSSKVPEPSKSITPSSYTSEKLGSYEKAQAMKQAFENERGYGSSKIENTFVYNVKGEDEQRLKKMIMEGVQEGVRYMQQGSGKSK